MAPLNWSECPAVESIPGKVSGAWVFKHRSAAERAASGSVLPQSAVNDQRLFASSSRLREEIARKVLETAVDRHRRDD
jgi:hypothetical protein